jgi:cation diffusion facilitator CzcD-associated flavoprotein CzcO
MSNSLGPPVSTDPRICVIGAGPSGLTTLKNLRQTGLSDVVCYEATDAIGGNWVFRESDSHSSVYASTHLISSRRLSQFEDYPMPADFPDYPSHSQVLSYFNAYARHFQVLPCIRLNTAVEHAAREADGRWRITVKGPQGAAEESFDYLLVCSGHHFDPMIPRYPGQFSGRSLHSHSYKRAEPFRGLRVLVVGGGNSACDIAADLSRVAACTALSMRRGYHIVPKIVFGMPVDVAYGRLRHLPKPIRRFILEKGLQLLVGPWRRYGLQAPARPLMEMHPTLNSDVLLQIRHGQITPRPGIARLDGRTVIFADGAAVEFDVIIWATGYRTSFPFFDRSFIDWSEALRLPLYLKMMPADCPNLYFIGLFQPIGCIWTLADYQARIAALQIAGRLERPKNLQQRIEREMTATHWAFEERPRHQAEVDYYDFRKALLRELKGARPALAAASLMSVCGYWRRRGISRGTEPKDFW